MKKKLKAKEQKMEVRYEQCRKYDRWMALLDQQKAVEGNNDR